jgi:DNA-binding NtrC family response regulator
MNFSKKKSNRNILIVDDEHDVLELLKLYLEAQNWVTTTVDSTDLALSYLKKDIYFLILTDIAMPDLDGYEFIKKIEELKIPSQIALMTGFGYNPNHTLVKINKISKYPIFFKPFQFKKPKIKNTVQSAWEEYHKDIK